MATGGREISAGGKKFGSESHPLGGSETSPLQSLGQSEESVPVDRHFAVAVMNLNFRQLLFCKLVEKSTFVSGKFAQPSQGFINFAEFLPEQRQQLQPNPVAR